MSCLRISQAAVLLFFAGALHTPAAPYHSNAELARELRALTATNPKLVHLSSLAKSRAQHDLWLVELGTGDEKIRRQRPALLVVAGIEGNDLVGTFSVLRWVQTLASRSATDEKIRKLLDTKTIYAFPRVNADAADAFFARPKVERIVSTLPVDDDHDGFLDEDGPDDLNGDGLITSMRVEEPEGEYILDETDPRLLLKADRARGEVGKWRYLTEGRDNDNDEAWNEDGPGGVNFNRNFPHNYKFFAPTAGVHQVSEGETRALADFVLAHPNIGIVFTFGGVDNLVQAPKAEAAGANKRPQTDLQPDDLPYYRELGKAWREALGLKKELSGPSEPGTFSDWIYFHRGRLSLAARPWTPGLQVELEKAPSDEKKEEKKEEKTDKPKEEKKDKKPDNRNEEERAVLKWFDKNAKEAFVPWKKIEHPDFPGKTVEVGGYAPFAKSNPPEQLLENLATKHGEFLTALAAKFPEVRLRTSKVKSLGEGIYDITLQIENAGYLPTSLAQGNVTREVHPTRVEINLDDKAVLSGSKRVTLNAIEGSGGMNEVRWVVHAPNTPKVKVAVNSMLGGSFETDIDLK
jgi:hypothetical protein